MSWLLQQVCSVLTTCTLFICFGMLFYKACETGFVDGLEMGNNTKVKSYANSELINFLDESFNITISSLKL